VTYLARLTQLAGIKEVTQGTYLVPTGGGAFSVPWDQAEYNDATAPLRDESVRANDAVLQGLAQGVYQADWSMTLNAYPDILGHFFVGMGMFDTVTAGVSTTLTANSLINATTLSLTATVAPNTMLKISDTGGANLEYVQISTVIGSGPFVATIAVGAGSGGNSTLFAHTAAGGSVVSVSTHTFRQNRTFSTTWPSYSFSTNDGAEIRGWAGCVLAELGIKIDPKGLVKISPKYTGWASATASSFTYAASTATPLPGWGWTVTNAQSSSTRGLTMDITLKRAAEAIHASSGTRGPREVFAGAAEIDGTYKAIFENTTDITLFRNYTQTPTVHTLTQPALFGGSVLAITMTQSGYVTAKVSNSQAYQQLDMTLSGVANATDGTNPVGIASATLTNYSAVAF
jgi:hypothetical protein